MSNASQPENKADSKAQAERTTLEDGIFGSLLSASSVIQQQQDSPAKRTKFEYLAYRGTKHTRVGNDYQVTMLPSPNAPQEDASATKEGHAGGQ
mmetsp:Transcript_6952/g.18865  ORF Transcript_6952/g.18865 Transcript_6952/m.18865 type:complete len:94 (+) Transcript_6952:228-509(+)|eukprot:CAMPEP_0198118618 /NCGR_PEP_ID=MMETSP1442-20131203/22477_1 /TAXON_ID= /ORGANISM="Craspedostauros australis, Strain CCMP3328" /LENGTH=93 /DNA_ID=CAMNT_0043776915 /DNA_START=224 /DNA_END=505 /DNA_ORIENTATION=-